MTKRKHQAVARYQAFIRTKARAIKINRQMRNIWAKHSWGTPRNRSLHNTN